MRRKTRYLLLASFVLALFSTNTASAETVSEAVKAALETHPKLTAEREGLAAQYETTEQARARRGFSIDLSGGTGFRDNQTSLPFSIGGNGAVTQMSLSVQRPVYTGGTLQALEDATIAQTMAAKANYTVSEHQMIIDVVTAYVNALRDQEDASIQANNVEVLSRELQAANDRFEAGVITRTDIAQAEARLSGAEAGLALAEATLEGSQAIYLELVGQLPESLIKPEQVIIMPTTIDEAFDIATEKNPMLIASRYSEEFQKANLRAIKGEGRPQISLSGEVTRQQIYGDQDFNDTTTTILAQGRVPLYTNGLQKAKEREASHRYNQSRIQTEALRRQVMTGVARAWHSHIAAEKAAEASGEQVKAVELSLEGLREELNVGTRTTLDLLNGEQEALNARLALLRAEHNAIIAKYQLLAIIGELDASKL